MDFGRHTIVTARVYPLIDGNVEATGPALQHVNALMTKDDYEESVN